MEQLDLSLDPSDDRTAISAAIREFLRERLQAKLDKLKDGEDDQRQALIAAHETDTWIADAARRVSQIQQVTHAIKFSHPDAKGSSLSSTGNAQAGDLAIGSHSIPMARLSPDVVGNAAALDVYKFLRLCINGRSLLERATTGDPALKAALSANPEHADAWIAAFAGLSAPSQPPATHRLAKQVYWPLDEGQYRLLAPLFPSAMIHTLWGQLAQDRFSPEAKAARTARWEKRDHPEGYREYPDLAVQNFGGTKPQNVSQLNSERRGENWLLPSLPPNWQSPPIHPPWFADSIFDRAFGRRPAVSRLTGELRAFLRRVAKRDSNRSMRDQRAELVGAICDELLQLAAELQTLDPGWTQDERCRLNEAECCWLDPGRAFQDHAFAARRRHGHWQDRVCNLFAHWLNAKLETQDTHMGQDEARAWQRVLDAELRLIRLELTD